jgi:hypothetical protein
MRNTGCYLTTLLITALSLGASLSHVLQIRGKTPWPAAFWRTAMETLYMDYAVIGGVTELGAIAAAWWLTFVTRRARSAFRWSLSGASLLTIAFLGLWLGFIAPINAVFATWSPGSMPSDWMVLRNRWETWHAVIAAMKAFAFCSLVMAVMRQTEQRSS